jgi:hypothetical protein
MKTQHVVRSGPWQSQVVCQRYGKSANPTSVASPLASPVEERPESDSVRELKSQSLRLKRMDYAVQDRLIRLINWGYAVCDASLRDVDSSLETPGGFPYSKVRV